MILSVLVLQLATVVAENPSPFSRNDWVRIATPNGFVRSKIQLGSYERRPFTIDQPQATTSGLALMADVPLPFTFKVNGVATELKLVRTSLEFPCIIANYRGRTPGSNIVTEIWGCGCSGESTISFELLIENSDPSNNLIYETATVEMVGNEGVQVGFWWPNWRGISNGHLLREVSISDTQGQAWGGYIARTGDPAGSAWQHGPITAMSLPVEWEGRWGPFGVIPRWQDYTPAAYEAELGRWRGRMATATANPWSVPDLGLAAGANQTGGQHDFGATKLGPAFLLPEGGPGHALHALQAAFAEANRPGGFREATGVPVDPLRHPDWVTWSAYTHFHRAVSGDRLGKDGQPTPHFAGGWVGKDREHWSINNLAGAYLLTGSPLLLHLVEREARAILSGETLDPRLSTSGIGAPRGIGRTLLSAAWIDCCLALSPSSAELRAQVRERIEGRMRLVELSTRRPSVLQPLGIQEDPRILRGIEAVQPWQEALGIIGLRAAQLRFGGEIGNLCQIVLERVCQTFINHGWWEEDGQWWMADAHAWNNGNPLPPSAYPGPLVERNEGFEEWSWGAVIISAAVVADSARASVIMRAMPPATSVSAAEWIAVR